MQIPTSQPYPNYFDTADGFVIHSPAKVNLSLRVLHKRSDGYHELDTFFQELDWGDEIKFQASNSFVLEIDGPELPKDDRNLITRAAKALSRAAGHPLAGYLHLSKMIPMQGGLGGGSSNASITLLGLNRLWGLNWPKDRLLPIAAELGADCPFFLFGGLAHATGRGDAIKPLRGALKGTLVLLFPGFGVETTSVFAEVKFPLTEVEKNVIFSPLVWTEEGGAYLQVYPCNDLENIVFRRNPFLKSGRDRLIELGAQVALLSGSGSTLYGVFDSDGAAIEAANKLSCVGDFRVKVCRAVARKR